ncbi:3-beta hydroxysteroid dehydrogenase [Paenibacillus ferrarius]|uniref:3-beta hydroxysteroid dehydrogenase n=1 Tax=Paenibacillus ferrarius TaxID=1469647 RepID=A0A1V4HI31_9BACL|nr:SDR family oxidoreductase [Paenibacillus ferrarius]OPH56207.1 3-beta hydroxysteroid dehydrogenase [Paenibacillus ferrarius]
MRIFVTGAAGYIGTAVVRELIGAGHQVVGLTRSESGAQVLESLGAEVARGVLEDLDLLRSSAATSDGVIHLAFNHDFSNFAASLATDLRAIEAMGEGLAGSGKPLVITAHANGKASEDAALAFVEQGVRASIVSLAPSVHGEGDKGFVPQLIRIARERGSSAYIGDGTNRWPAIHRLDAAVLFRLAVESAPAGSRLDGVDDEGIPFSDIAGVIGSHVDVPVVSIPREEAQAIFGFLGMVASLDLARSSEGTKELLGWKPVQHGLLADLEQGHYFTK